MLKRIELDKKAGQKILFCTTNEAIHIAYNLGEATSPSRSSYAVTIKNNEQDQYSPLYHEFYHELSYFGENTMVQTLTCNKASSTFSIILKYPESNEETNARLLLFNAHMIGVNNLKVIHSARKIDTVEDTPIHQVNFINIYQPWDMVLVSIM